MSTFVVNVAVQEEIRQPRARIMKVKTSSCRIKRMSKCSSILKKNMIKIF